jgi:hypothetical protein
MDPVAPAAADTTTVSPSVTLPTSIMPKNAVIPVTPSTLRATTGSIPAGTTCIMERPSSAMV